MPLLLLLPLLSLSLLPLLLLPLPPPPLLPRPPLLLLLRTRSPPRPCPESCDHCLSSHSLSLPGFLR